MYDEWEWGINTLIHIFMEEGNWVELKKKYTKNINLILDQGGWPQK